MLLQGLVAGGAAGLGGPAAAVAVLAGVGVLLRTSAHALGSHQGLEVLDQAEVLLVEQQHHLVLAQVVGHLDQVGEGSVELPILVVLDPLVDVDAHVRVVPLEHLDLVCDVALAVEGLQIQAAGLQGDGALALARVALVVVLGGALCVPVREGAGLPHLVRHQTVLYAPVVRVLDVQDAALVPQRLGQDHVAIAVVGGLCQAERSCHDVQAYLADTSNLCVGAAEAQVVELPKHVLLQGFEGGIEAGTIAHTNGRLVGGHGDAELVDLVAGYVVERHHALRDRVHLRSDELRPLRTHLRTQLRHRLVEGDGRTRRHGQFHDVAEAPDTASVDLGHCEIRG